MTVEVIAPINIALLKYWGKSDYLNIEPVADSLSLTLSTDHLHSRTQISLKDGTGQHFTLNGKPEELTSRMKDVILAAQLRAMQQGTFTRFQSLKIASYNSFPTAAGLASSASGLASLAFGLFTLYRLGGDISSLARRGSGSACRSMFGGVVHWQAPSPNRTSSSAKQLFPHTHWPELRVLICVTSSEAKGVSSRVAMRRTVETSALFAAGRAAMVAERLPRFVAALAQRDFGALAELTMRESNALHALCLDSWPPALYLSPASFAIIRAVHAVNEHFGRYVLAYTFDAGPNAFLLTLAEDAPMVLALLRECFGEAVSNNGDAPAAKKPRLENHLEVKGIQYPAHVDLTDCEALLQTLPRLPGAIKCVISTEMGPGPQILSKSF